MNKGLKGARVRNLSVLKSVARAGTLLVCEKVGIKVGSTMKEKEPFRKRRIEKNITVSKKVIKPNR